MPLPIDGFAPEPGSVYAVVFLTFAAICGVVALVLNWIKS